MNTQEAIKILRQHNAWRKGDKDAISPLGVTEAIDMVCDELEKRPLLTEFERYVEQIADTVAQNPWYDMTYIKEVSADLLEIAKKQLREEFEEQLDTLYKNQDEVVFEKGKEEGRREALKDMPRWEKVEKDGCFDKPQRFLLDAGRDGIFYCTGEYVPRDGYLLFVDDLLKLPKEE